MTVLAGAGRTGSQVVDQALACGWQVTALVRRARPGDEGREGLCIIEGDLRDGQQVNRALQGTTAVLCAAGPGRGTAPEDVTLGLRQVVDVMQQRGVRRLVAVATAACRLPGDRRSLEAALSARFVRLLIGRDVRAKEEQLGLLRDSGLEWTALRPPRLTDEPARGGWRVGSTIDLGFSASLPRADLAGLLLAQLQDRSHIGQAPFCAAG